MKRKILIAVFSLVLLLSFGSVERVWACKCVDYKPQEVYNFSDVVFIGKVIEGLTKLKGKENSYYVSSELTTFEVTEAFAGVQKGEKVKVDGGNIFGYCPFPVLFFTNNEYVVYAQRNEKNIYETNNCLRSKMTDVSTNEQREYQGYFRKEIMEDIDFLRETLPLKKNALLKGRVGLTTDDALIVKIIIKDKNFPQKTFTTKSNDQGNFSIELPEGEYKLEIKIPKGRKLTKWAKEKLESIKLRTGGEVNLYIDLEKIK